MPTSVDTLGSVDYLPHSLAPISPIAGPTQSPIPVDLDFQPENLSIVLSIPSVSLHPMQTRSKSGKSKKKVLSAMVKPFVLVTELATFKSANKVP